MEGNGSGSASEKRKRLLPLLLAIAVAAIIVLSYTLLAYYQDTGARDAAYKAQYVLAQIMGLNIVNMMIGVQMMTNDSSNLTERYDAGQIATSNLGELSVSCEVMKHMFSATSVEYLTFDELERASSSTRVACSQVLATMWENITNDDPYVPDVNRVAAIRSASYLFFNITSCIGQGYDSSKDWQTDPYCVVCGMDLEGIRVNAELIVDIVS